MTNRASGGQEGLIPPKNITNESGLIPPKTLTRQQHNNMLWCNAVRANRNRK